jgi:hypothetical protein
MNTQPAQPIPGNGQHPDQQCYDKLDCPDQPMTAINAAQLADILDGFLRHGDGIADRLADYLHATGRDHPNPQLGRLQRQPAHRPSQLHRPLPACPPPRTATVTTALG